MLKFIPRFLENTITPWMNDTATGKKYVFQKDRVPVHVDKTTIEFLKRSNVIFWEKGINGEFTPFR